MVYISVAKNQRNIECYTVVDQDKKAVELNKFLIQTKMNSINCQLKKDK